MVVSAVREAAIGDEALVCKSLRVTFGMLARLKNVSSADDDESAAELTALWLPTSTSVIVSPVTPVSDSAPTSSSAVITDSTPAFKQQPSITPTRMMLRVLIPQLNTMVVLNMKTGAQQS